MTKILAFDSIYMVNALRKIYIALIWKILNRKKTSNNSLVLYRLDRDNVLLREEQNISGMTIGLHKDNIDAMSIKFYQHLKKTGTCDALAIKNIKIYDLYTRQVKLKLAGLLICAKRIQNFSIANEGSLEIITDRQTVSIMKETFSFLQFETTNIIWKTNSLLTWCITVNSFLMRTAALLMMIVSPSGLPKNYFYKHNDPASPTVVITAPRRRPDDFFSSYVKKFSNNFNIILYSTGFFHSIPQNFKRIKIKQKPGVLRGLFNIKNLCFSSDSYIADILIVFNKHKNLNRSIDVVRSIFSNKIDAHISRLQTNVIDNYLAIEAKRRGVFILGDLMEEIFHCDSVICSSASDNTEPFRLSLTNESKIIYKGNNSNVNYRLKNFNEKQIDYLHCLLGFNNHTKIIFYASDPSKDESQRYLTEKLLIDYFSRLKDYVLVIKTHPQDKGTITNYAYMDSKSPSNVILIGDWIQKGRISSNFLLFEYFDFNAALSSCDGFLTSSSSSILQALVLDAKAGIVDMFSNGHYDYLITHKAAMLVDNEESFQKFLEAEKLDVTDEILSFCGLKKNDKEFDVGEHLLNCLKKID
jgi:hypothetical protein